LVIVLASVLRFAGGTVARRRTHRTVVIGAATLGLIAFFVWYYALSNAYIIPFMPSR